MHKPAIGSIGYSEPILRIKKAGGTISEEAEKEFSRAWISIKLVTMAAAMPRTSPSRKHDEQGESQIRPAMCSTQKDVYGKENLHDPTTGTEVPRIPLLSALGAASGAGWQGDQIAINLGNGKTLPPRW